MNFATGPDANLHVDSPSLPFTSFGKWMYHFNFDLKVLIDIGNSANQETNARLLSWGKLTPFKDGKTCNFFAIWCHCIYICCETYCILMIIISIKVLKSLHLTVVIHTLIFFVVIQAIWLLCLVLLTLSSHGSVLEKIYPISINNTFCRVGSSLWSWNRIEGCQKWRNFPSSDFTLNYIPCLIK